MFEIGDSVEIVSKGNLIPQGSKCTISEIAYVDNDQLLFFEEYGETGIYDKDVRLIERNESYENNL